MQGVMIMTADVRHSQHPDMWELFLQMRGVEYYIRRWDSAPTPDDVVDFIVGEVTAHREGR